ncbi:hypothetical protein WJ87_11620 [Burkholderia ubonensis]|nr:hypothetical protein WJ87_11620 [Burkholderia ubonensis]
MWRRESLRLVRSLNFGRGEGGRRFGGRLDFDIEFSGKPMLLPPAVLAAVVMRDGLGLTLSIGGICFHVANAIRFDWTVFS